MSKRFSKYKGWGMPVAFALSCLLILVGCRKDEVPGGGVDFDRSALLRSYADDFILPAYEAHQARLSALVSTLEGLSLTPGQNSLEEARIALHEAWLSWQSCSLYDFGPAANRGLLFASNVYPTDSSKIQANIQADNVNLASGQNLDAGGFPALDFLLYGEGKSDEEVLSGFAADGGALLYALLIADYMSSATAAVLNDWKPSGGDYRNTFVTSTGVDVGSSLGLMLNAFNRVYEEHIRKNKLGLPCGVMTFSMTPLPDHVEGYYSQVHSLEYLSAALDACGQFIEGSNGLGLSDYLDALGATHHDQSLSGAIRGQMSETLDQLTNLEGPLSSHVVTDQQGCIDTYAEMQQLVVLCKVDMMSALGVLITYQDNDGD